MNGQNDQSEALDAGAAEFLHRRRRSRESALQFLYQMETCGDSELVDDTLDGYWEHAGEDGEPLSGRDLRHARPFAERLVRGVCSERESIDQVLQAAAKNWSVERMSVVDRCILRIAAYELIHCEDVPDVAAIDEAVELAKQYGDRDTPRFVNGILDRLLRDRRDATDSSTCEDKTEDGL